MGCMTVVQRRNQTDIRMREYRPVLRGTERIGNAKNGRSFRASLLYCITTDTRFFS